MNRILKLMLIGGMLTFAFGACKKGEDDSVAPTINVLSPLEGNAYALADSLNIEAIIDDEDLHEFTVEVTRQSDDVTVYSFKGHSHDRNYRLSKSTKIVQAGTYELDIEAEDHNGNETEVKYLFTITE